jgi:glycosyltransferase involved in cell wall biosynthesis
MKISILLPYKENFSPQYPGAVSIFLSSVINKSSFKNKIIVFGSTEYVERYKNIKYINITIPKKIFRIESITNKYISKFLELENKRNSNIIEVHNRPTYLFFLNNTKAKKVLYFHNDPLSMNGSKTINDRLELLMMCSFIVFNSEWSKSRFLHELDPFYSKSSKLKVIYQTTERKKIDCKKKQKIITFVGKLNKAKGYDIFGSSIIKILNKYKEWKAIVIGDESREKLIFNHKNLSVLGFQKHNKVINYLKKSSISVVCSRWEEPFGRTSLESASCGCAVIITNRGGLPETITNGVILNDLTINSVFTAISKLIENKKYRTNLQKKSLKNFSFTNLKAVRLIDQYRNNLSDNSKLLSISNKKLKILHVTNFNERHNGRLFYNTGRRINNGFIRLNHSVLEFSDRDIVSYYRNISDLDGSKRLNKKFIEVISNYVPDIIVFGHADLIKRETIISIKNIYPDIKMCQWFLDRMDSEWIINLSRFKNKLDLMDANFCTTNPEKLKISKIKTLYYLPNPVDYSLDKLENFKNKFLPNDIFFAMSHGVHRGILKMGKYDEREKFIKKLQELTPNIKYDLYGIDNKQPIWADDFINKISKSKMAINLSQGKAIKYYSSDRIAQLMGNGLLVFVDEKTKLSNFFNKNEIITYNNISDLANKIKKFSDNDNLRIKIAKNGRNKYFKYFNSTLIAEYILNKTFNMPTKKYYWENK